MSANRCGHWALPSKTLGSDCVSSSGRPQACANLFATCLALVALIAAGCSGDDHEGTAPTEYNNDPKVLNIVMGSEQHLVFDQIVRPWCEKNGLTCDAQELGSVDQANKLSEDCTNLPPYDIFWFASTVFEQIGNERCNKLVDSKPMFSSPIVFAGWQHVMDRLGFTPGSNTSIQHILDAVEGRQDQGVDHQPHSVQLGRDGLLRIPQLVRRQSAG